MSWLSDTLFGSSQKLKPYDIRSQEQENLFNQMIGSLGQPVTNYLSSLGQALPKNVYMPTSMTDLQKSLMGQIPGVTGGGPFTQSPLFKQAIGVMSKAAEAFDPFKDTRLSAFKSSLEQELRRAKDRIAARTSSKDKFFGGGRLSQEREFEETGFNQLGTLAAQLEAEARQQAIGAAQTLPGLAAMESQAPMDWLNQSLQLANIPRAFQEEQRLAEYNELLRQRGEMPFGVQTASNLSMYSPPLMYPQYAHTPGLYGGLSGVGPTPTSGINPYVVGAEAIAKSMMGMSGGMGGMGGAMMNMSGGGLSSLPGYLDRTLNSWLSPQI